DLFVDGYISRTFQCRQAEQYFLDLLKSNSIPQVENVFYPGREGSFFLVGHSTYSRLLDRTIAVTGTVVPQTIWSPHTITDRMQHVTNLQMPIFFESVDGRPGLSLDAATNGRFSGLRNAQEFAPLGHMWTTHIRIAWPGYQVVKRQVPIRDETSAHNLITISRFAHHIGRSVDAFLRASQWQIGPSGIQRSDIIVIGAVHVTAGSWMPILQLNRYIF
ncbi:hypothetical protein EDB86DRAFT_2811101, partial [Lactarius hatsudake]